MRLSRRHLLTTVGAALPVLTLAPACRAQAAPPADLSTADGWLSWAGDHRDQLALTLDDGRGHQLSHHADRQQPLASAIKVVHLAAYAIAVTEGRLHPDDRVRVGDWERFYVPTDGGAHPAALRELGIATDATGLYAADPEATATLDQLVAVMIKFSDSAVPDLLRDRLGQDTVRAAAESGGWPDADVRSLCAEYLFLALPEHAPPPGTPVPLRRAMGYDLERRYSTDPDLRKHTLDRLLGAPLPPYAVQEVWASGTTSGPADALANLHRAIATTAFLPRQAAEIAREHLERPHQGSLPPGIVGLGYKGGSLPGVLTAGLSVRRADGSIGAGALLAHGGVSAEQLANGDPSLPLLLALEDPAWRDRLARALRI